MSPAVVIKNVSKKYKNGLLAVNRISLTLDKGEVFCLLGPNGAGKSTLINIICGIVSQTSGIVLIDGYDTVKSFRQARKRIGLVPQEMYFEPFETVWKNVRYSRALYGEPKNDEHIHSILTTLSLGSKKNHKLNQLSGGMKRRVLIAKALSHEPSVLFLDEPTAGVDVELRKDMWRTINNLKDKGVTIIMTTHYLEEAEALADRIGVIDKGNLLLVQNKNELIKALGNKTIVMELAQSIQHLPDSLNSFDLVLDPLGTKMTYSCSLDQSCCSIGKLLDLLHKEGIFLRDIATQNASLERIFIDFIKGSRS